MIKSERFETEVDFNKYAKANNLKKLYTVDINRVRSLTHYGWIKAKLKRFYYIEL